MHSPDRRYWWDGAEWRSAVSADGRRWFDGARWVPNPLSPFRVQRVPTRWTLPLQVAVIAMTVLGLASFVSIWWLALHVPIQNMVSAEMPREQAAGTTQAWWAAGIGNGVAVLALAVVIVVGSVRRWTWVFWASLVGFGLVAIGPLAGLLPALFVPPQPMPAGAGSPSIPTPSLAAVALTLMFPADVAVFAGMVVAALSIGPWACRRTVQDGVALKPAGSP